VNCGKLTRRQVFLNIVLDDAIEEKANGEKERIGQVVCCDNGQVNEYQANANTGHSWKLGGDA